MTDFLVFFSKAEADAAALAIYQELNLDRPDRLTISWDSPRQRLDGLWIILAPPNYQPGRFPDAALARFQSDWFSPLQE